MRVDARLEENTPLAFCGTNPDPHVRPSNGFAVEHHSEEGHVELPYTFVVKRDGVVVSEYADSLYPTSVFALLHQLENGWHERHPANHDLVDAFRRGDHEFWFSERIC